jgi:hypothetical protein
VFPIIFFSPQIEIVIATDEICIILSFIGPESQKDSACEILIVTEISFGSLPDTYYRYTYAVNQIALTFYNRVFGPFEDVNRF